MSNFILDNWYTFYFGCMYIVYSALNGCFSYFVSTECNYKGYRYNVA